MGERRTSRVTLAWESTVLTEKERLLTTEEIEQLTYYQRRRLSQFHSWSSVIASAVVDTFSKVHAVVLLIVFILVLNAAFFLFPPAKKPSSRDDWVIAGSLAIVLSIELAYQYMRLGKERADGERAFEEYLNSLRDPCLIWDCRPVHSYRLIPTCELGSNNKVDSTSRFLFDLGGSLLYVPSEALSEQLLWGGVDGAMVHNDIQAKAERYFPNDSFKYICTKTDGSPIGFVCEGHVISPASLPISVELVQKLGRSVKLFRGSKLETLLAV